MQDFCHSLPKVELHAHLNGSLRDVGQISGRNGDLRCEPVPVPFQQKGGMSVNDIFLAKSVLDLKDTILVFVRWFFCVYLFALESSNLLNPGVYMNYLLNISIYRTVHILYIA